MPRFCWLTLLLIFIFFTGCNRSSDRKEKDNIFPPELVNFVPYEHNPVFAGTGKDTWDRQIRERGYILREDGQYRMWYTGYNDQMNPTKFLGLATSEDGYHWTRYENNPIFDEYWTEDVQVVKHEGLYYMVAEGVDDIAHMLTSRDGIKWQRSGDLDVRKTNGEPIDPGAYGTPTLWIEDDVWYLFYEREDLGIWLARSTDQRVWTNIKDEPVIERGPEAYDSEGVALNQVIKYRDRYYAWYHGTPVADWSHWNSNVAVSDDLIHWVKYEKNPVLGADSLTWDVSSPIIVHDGNRFRLYTMHDQVRVFLPITKFSEN